MEGGGGRGGGERTDAGLFHDGSVAGGDSTAEEADLFEGCLRVDGDDGDIGYDGVLRECRGAHLDFTFCTFRYILCIRTYYFRLTKWWMDWPLQVKRLVLSGIRPWP